MQNTLCEETAFLLNHKTEGLGYDRSSVQIGIVHLGPGAFHRAHQAVYTDDLLRLGAKEWGICAVSICSASVRDALQQQDNLYTLAILDRKVSYRVIGAVKEILVAPDDPQCVIRRMSQLTTKVITLTVTEKGYCLTAEGGLDFVNEAIQHDLTNPESPRSAIGFLAAGLRCRRENGIPPFIPISCDNLTENGARLGRAVIEFADALDRDFGAWIEREVRFPCTMVDSITPATDDTIRKNVAEFTGLCDNWPVQRERFCQWVIEDLPGVVLPPWSDVGVTLTKDVGGFETTKLRILNCLHSALAFVGTLAEMETVEEAVSSESIGAYLEQMMEEEIIPTLPFVEGLNPVEYGERILERFKNPAIRHLLSQIAWDSTQKIPFRILGTIEENLDAGKGAARLSLALAAWMKFVCKQVKEGTPINDPLADKLKTIAQDCNGSAQDVARFLELEEVFPQTLIVNARFRNDVTRAYGLLGENPGPVAILAALKNL